MWYPSQENPVKGIFVKEHAKAVALYNDVVVFAFSGGSRSLISLYEADEQIEDGIRTIRIKHKVLPVSKVSYFVNLWAVFASFRKLVHDGWRPDVIHAHIYSAGVPAIILGKMYSLPVVVTEHFTGFPRRLIHGFSRMQAKFAFEWASLVCPVSEDLKKSIESYGIRARFKVIPNVVDISLFSLQGSYDGGKTGESKKRILLVALLDPKKGIPYLLEALANLKKKRSDFILDIVGDGSYRSEYEALARELDLADMVRFHGLKTKQEVSEFMKRCDFFVLPSLFETFGVVFIEALACGKPVIGPDIGGPNEIITTDAGKLVPPANTDALTAAIGYMIDHYKDYSPEKMAQYARERFSYMAVGQMLDRVYREVIFKQISL